MMMLRIPSLHVPVFVVVVVVGGRVGKYIDVVMCCILQPILSLF